MRYLIAMIINGRVEIVVVTVVPQGAQVMAQWREKENV